MACGTFACGPRWPPMPQRAIHPPIHLVTHSDEPIRPLEGAAKVIRRHAGDHLDHKAEDVLRQIKRATTLEQADAAGKPFVRGRKGKACCWCRRKTERAANQI